MPLAVCGSEGAAVRVPAALGGAALGGRSAVRAPQHCSHKGDELKFDHNGPICPDSTGLGWTPLGLQLLGVHFPC